jgi:hypothetical protein
VHQSSVLIGVRFRPEIADHIRQIADREGNPASAVIRRIVLEGLRSLDAIPAARQGRGNRDSRTP